MGKILCLYTADFFCFLLEEMDRLGTDSITDYAEKKWKYAEVEVILEDRFGIEFHADAS